jgi:arylsulfatase
LSHERPNIILILADDLGYAELGSYGQEKIHTPHIDQMAQEGMRFTQFYSGSPVCAPSRCVLITGQHSGHAFIRDNKEIQPEGQYPLPDSVLTIAEALRSEGYSTGVIGKWGLGPPGSKGDPCNQGFDYFYGYNCQRHAHNHYPRYLWQNDQQVILKGNSDGVTGEQYSHDLFEREALAFITNNANGPFFLLLALTIPHLALQVPDEELDAYVGQWKDPSYDGTKGYLPHPSPRAAYAAMVTRMDRSVGRILQRLEDLAIDRRTIVVFTSDNGPTYDRIGGSDSEFFRSAGVFRGLKGSVYEGGIRVPLIIRWPGTIASGTVSSHLAAFQDFFPTLSDVAGLPQPDGSDGISFLPTLRGQPNQDRHEYLYWEFAGYGGQQAVRWGSWKAVRRNLHKGNLAIELYDLEADLGELNDIASEHGSVVTRMKGFMDRSHTPSPVFPIQALDIPQ